jgi:hypothetical protein
MKTEMLAIISGLFSGLVMVDVDHITPYPLFHYIGTVMFFLFLSIFLLINLKKE